MREYYRMPSTFGAERPLAGLTRYSYQSTESGEGVTIASEAGVGGVDVMRRAFVRLLGITPRRYRELAGHPIGD